MGHFEKTTDTNEETTVIMDAVYATIRKTLYSLGNFEIYRALHQNPVVVSSSVVVKNIAQSSISENTMSVVNGINLETLTLGLSSAYR